METVNKQITLPEVSKKKYTIDMNNKYNRYACTNEQ